MWISLDPHDTANDHKIIGLHYNNDNKIYITFINI